jgi:hypothetical protein
MSNIVVAIFPSRSILASALDHIMSLRDLEMTVERAAIVGKDAQGETIILNDQITANEGGIAGGILGFALAALAVLHFELLSLPLLAAVGAILMALTASTIFGAMVGGGAANLVNRNRHHLNLPFEALSRQLHAGRLALVLVVNDNRELLARISQELKLFEAELLPQPT